MLALVKSLSGVETTGDYMHERIEQLQLVTTRFKKISLRLTHIFNYNNTNLYVSIIVKDNSLLDYFGVIELVRSSNVQINKYIPRTYFFLKRYLTTKYACSTLAHHQNIEIKNGASQGYFFLKRNSMVDSMIVLDCNNNQKLTAVRAIFSLNETGYNRL